MVFLQSTGASRYNNCCIDSSTSPENIGYTSYVTTGTFCPFQLTVSWPGWNGTVQFVTSVYAPVLLVGGRVSCVHWRGGHAKMLQAYYIASRL
jgi:hypothetical protein